MVVRCDKGSFSGMGGGSLRCLYLKEDHDSSDRLHGLFLGSEGLSQVNMTDDVQVNHLLI